MLAPDFAHKPLWLTLGWGLVLLVAYLSLTPTPPTADIANFDKIGHILAYAALMGWWSQLDQRRCRLGLLFVLLGLGLEIAQTYTDTRQGDIFDAAADCIGVGLGWLSSRLLPNWLAWIDGRLAHEHS